MGEHRDLPAHPVERIQPPFSVRLAALKRVAAFAGTRVEVREAIFREGSRTLFGFSGAIWSWSSWADLFLSVKILPHSKDCNRK